MKIFLSKINLAALALLLLVLANFSSCKKDDDTQNNSSNLRQAIVGEWEVRSFTIDGAEVLGTVILASKMEFEVNSGSNSDFAWRLNYSDNSNETQIGDYEVAQEGKEVELKSNDGDILKLDVAIDGDDLRLSGSLDDERIVIKADRD